MAWRTPVRVLSRVPVCVDVAARSFAAPALSSNAEHDTGHSKFRLTADTMNLRVRDMQYAVRGKLPLEARRIEEHIKQVRCISN